jgi:hypothetical protein
MILQIIVVLVVIVAVGLLAAMYIVSVFDDLFSR